MCAMSRLRTIPHVCCQARLDSTASANARFNCFNCFRSLLESSGFDAPLGVASSRALRIWASDVCSFAIFSSAAPLSARPASLASSLAADEIAAIVFDLRILSRETPIALAALLFPLSCG